MTQKAVNFPATAEEIDRDMLTPPNNHATDDSDTDTRKNAADQIYEEE